jgi:hypothetical protein
MACRPCNPIPCDNPPDLAAGIDGAIYSALDYSFIVDCPEGCFCPAGLFPQTISILASTIPPVIPPIDEPAAPIVLRLQGCSSLITRTLSATATQAEINAAAQSMQAEWAGQQAECNALLEPGVNCSASDATFIDVCNDGESFICPYSGPIVIAPNTLCQRLITTGMTQAQIDAAVAQIKANLNFNAHNEVCLKMICEISIEQVDLPGFSACSLFIKNVSSVTQDLSQFQYCNGGFCIPPNGAPPATVAGNSTVLFASLASAIPATFNMFYAGQLLISRSPPIGKHDLITITIAC